MGCSATSPIQLIDHHRQTIMLFTGWKKKGFQPKKNEPRTKGIAATTCCPTRPNTMECGSAQKLANLADCAAATRARKNATPH